MKSVAEIVTETAGMHHGEPASFLPTGTGKGIGNSVAVFLGHPLGWGRKGDTGFSVGDLGEGGSPRGGLATRYQVPASGHLPNPPTPPWGRPPRSHLTLMSILKMQTFPAPGCP